MCLLFNQKSLLTISFRIGWTFLTGLGFEKHLYIDHHSWITSIYFHIRIISHAYYSLIYWVLELTIFIIFFPCILCSTFFRAAHSIGKKAKEIRNALKSLYFIVTYSKVVQFFDCFNRFFYLVFYSHYSRSHSIFLSVETK